MKREIRSVVIVGASSGIGREIASIYAERGCHVAVCARRVEKLEELAARFPERVTVHRLDVTSDDASVEFREILEAIEIPDIVINCAGIGFSNEGLNEDWDSRTVATNCQGFTAIADTAFNFFAASGRQGQIAAITSVAATRPLGAAVSYSASKRFQAAYLEGLDQLRRMRRLPIKITDLWPGFVATDLLKGDVSYPMLMQAPKVARLAVRAIDRRRRVAVIDWRWNILVGLWRLIPNWLWVRLPIRQSL